MTSDTMRMLLRAAGVPLGRWYTYAADSRLVATHDGETVEMTNIRLAPRGTETVEAIASAAGPMGIAVPARYGPLASKFVDPREVLRRTSIQEVEWYEIAALCEFAIRELQSKGAQVPR
jgi:hypothetical protein